MPQSRWILPTQTDPTQVHILANELQVSRVLAELLVAKGFHDGHEAREFLNPKLSSLSDPFLLPDMDKAVDRILAAIDKKERIILYGDYDVDGLTSTTLLQRILKQYNAVVECFLPQRKEEGYGLSDKGIARCLSEYRPQLLIAIDCGTSSVEEIKLVRQNKVEVVVLDHHECPDVLPECEALVNPKRGNDFTYLCSVGLTFKVGHALMKKRPNPKIQLKDYLDLVALGTVADLVPLVAENRILVKKGLEQLAVTKWQGIKTLAKKAGVKTPWVSSDVGFKIGPRLNAAGRLGEAKRAFHLLMASAEEEAEELADALEEENQNRREIGEDVLKLAEQQVSQRINLQRDATIIVGDEGWHEGVIGIVASKLMGKYNRPCIVVGFDEHGLGKGSCRSVRGFSLVKALHACEAHLDKYGGHDMAAGLSVRRSEFEAFKEAFGDIAKTSLRLENLVPTVMPDVEVHLHELTPQLLDQLDKMGPFGTSNHSPLMLLRDVSRVGTLKVMKEKHLSMEIRQGKQSVRAIWFNGVAEVLPEPPWDIAFDLTRNEYQGHVEAQVQIRALRKAT
jgi:single-stranded-DNA-specific exonuclease